MNTTTDKAVAGEILRQLGGNRFIAMTGARNFCCDNNSIVFMLPARLSKDKINAVRIDLNCMDTYDIKFMSIISTKAVKIVYEIFGVYNDMLVSVFEDKTGLKTSL